MNKATLKAEMFRARTGSASMTGHGSAWLDVLPAGVFDQHLQAGSLEDFVEILGRALGTGSADRNRRHLRTIKWFAHEAGEFDIETAFIYLASVMLDPYAVRVLMAGARELKSRSDKRNAVTDRFYAERGQQPNTRKRKNRKVEIDLDTGRVGIAGGGKHQHDICGDTLPSGSTDAFTRYRESRPAPRSPMPLFDLPK
ncbi:MAG: hypothetical protein V4641_12930 [Pseudomonadota bacterium]